MSRTILVGVDGAQGGTDALALARRLAVPTTELVAVSIAVLDAIASRGANLEYDRVLRERTHLRLVDVRAQDPELRTEVHTAASVGAGLHAVAASLEADLIVVGSCRRGPVGRLFVGDDVRQTLRGAPCAVAVAPRDYALRDGPVATIGLGFSPGTDGEAALEVARELAAGLGGRVHALAVAAISPDPLLDGVTPSADLDAEIARALDAMGGLDDVETTAVAGFVVDELAVFADEVDVLVVGSHQLGPLGRVTLGSVSEALARRCTRPLVVVPRARQTAGSPS